MTEQRTPYRTQGDTLLQPNINGDNMNATHEPVDWSQLERILIPLLNWVRKIQGKKPIIVPKG